MQSRIPREEFLAHKCSVTLAQHRPLTREAAVLGAVASSAEGGALLAQRCRAAIADWLESHGKPAQQRSPIVGEALRAEEVQRGRVVGRAVETAKQIELRAEEVGGAVLAALCLAHDDPR